MPTPRKPDLSREYAALIAAYIHKNYGGRGLEIRREVSLGTSIIGKKRRLDLLLVEHATQKGLALECKWQDVGGTADEKIPYALRDIEAMSMPGAVIYAGSGMSRGVTHLLQASGSAVYCLPNPKSLAPLPTPRSLGTSDCSTWELDHLLAVTFGWWDVLPAPLSAAAFNALTWPNLTKLLEDRERRAPKRVDRKRDAGNNDGKLKIPS